MTAEPPPAPYDEAVRAAPRCYRHADRETYIRCARCERPICPECMTPAAVGFQCPECIRDGARSVRQAVAPFGGRRPSGNPVTLVLIGLNALFFLITAGGGGDLLTGGATSSLFQRLSLISGPISYDGVTTIGVAQGEYYRLLTSCFLHFGVLHLAVNMYSLYLLGSQLERILGWSRFLGIYLVAGLGGSVATYALSSAGTQSAGASGAIFGLFAAYFIIAKRVGADTGAILATVGINLFITFAIPFISKTGHLGGLAVGAVAALVVVYAPHGPRRTALQVGGLAAIVVLLCVVVIVRTAQLS